MIPAEEARKIAKTHVSKETLALLEHVEANIKREITKGRFKWSQRLPNAFDSGIDLTAKEKQGFKVVDLHHHAWADISWE